MTHVFNIDLDAKCPQCGKGGSVNGGLCFECADKKIKQTIEKRRESNMIDGIGQKAIDQMKQQATNLIEGHKRKLQEVFLRAEDEGMKISLGITLKQVGTRIAVKTTIAYVVEKVGDEQSGFVDENQPGLFPVSNEKLVASK